MARSKSASTGRKTASTAKSKSSGYATKTKTRKKTAGAKKGVKAPAPAADKPPWR